MFEETSVLNLQNLSYAQKINNNEISENLNFTEKRGALDANKQILQDINYGLHLDYKSGATYEGDVKDNLKSGHGAFVWPNGDKYIGEFKLNSRHGFGRDLFVSILFYNSI